MADQLRWFKVWTSLLVDMDDVPDEIIGKWTRLGCRIALVGDNGRVKFNSREHLAAFLKIPADALETVTNRIPSVSIEEGQNRHGSLTVTFSKWPTYQRDSTAAQRQRASRAKRRGEETREEEIRKDTTPLPPKGSPASPDGFDDFWKAYPKERRRGRFEALKAWRALKLTPAQVSQVMASLASWNTSADWRKDEGKFIPWPQKFLNRRRWEETVEREPDELDFLRPRSELP